MHIQDDRAAPEGVKLLKRESRLDWQGQKALARYWRPETLSEQLLLLETNQRRFKEMRGLTSPVTLSSTYKLWCT